ncbi:TAXI family TRAP transporter solute-binding subunit [Limnothrix sp. FACHB-881]|uniref:TAXI family TRAP transporter solute-binding subunit n=1 Tax=unclassified Limnothrix TaxID=2632864 RepID=UPI0016830086|nr:MULTISPECIES: TAXI family TRAP transporter solute-binding subunit [unclassified Limnothrix]MBD2553758.1 TAXI family TRAP transporter solute-binding subunit [Limnothrix sp. FACHB-708]MBD2591229.1 TAXI family TRAP transporter solute-binding subunit [Limnothrix sp. FACHB-406]MBD2634803.1 TAXI family TRAP transporter solute-binding subunit [Limnothrix sp. FACHB-881]
MVKLKQRGWGLVSLVIVGVIGVGGCGQSKNTVSISAGKAGVGYDLISEQLGRSTDRIVSLKLTDDKNSNGSRDNLDRLVQGRVDFALAQLDVSRDLLRSGQVETVAILGHEYLHLLVRADSPFKTLTDINGKRVAIGIQGSGTNFTTTQILTRSGLRVITSAPPLKEGLAKLKAGELDMVAYVGPLGSSSIIQNAITSDPPLRLLEIPPSITNHLAVRFPESYRSSVIPAGTYDPLRPEPPQDLPVLSTGIGLMARGDAPADQVGLMAWSILATARQYASFYPELADGDPAGLLQRGGVYMAPDATETYEKGDPRSAWLRFIEENQVVQEYLLVLGLSSAAGLLVTWLRSRRSRQLVKSSRQALTEIKEVHGNKTKAALAAAQDLAERYRLMFIDGNLSPETYEEIDRPVQLYLQSCQALIEQEDRQTLSETVNLLDDSEALLNMPLSVAVQRLQELEDRYSQMLLSGTIELMTYLQFRQWALAVLQAKSHEPETPAIS